jgi:hypothetical protein
MSLTRNSVIAQDSEPVAARVDGEVVMLSERAGAYFGLNSVGSEIWQQVAQPRRVSEICAALSEIYDIDESALEQRVIAFLEELLARGLVRIADRGE